MQKRTTIAHRIAALAAGATVVAGSLLSMATPAHAYITKPNVNVITKSTTNCWPCTYKDKIDNTYFQHDPGGRAVKMELKSASGNAYLGKVEFHPLDELLYVYDTKNDNDAFYGTLQWYASGRWQTRYFNAPATAKTVDMRKYNFSIPEGKEVDITLWDNSNETGYIGSASGTA